MKIEDKNANVSFPVIGIGASAGGLEQYTAFFKKMPPDSGAAFILVQHLAPDHKSILTEIIQKQTKMPVVTAEDGLGIVPNTVYVLPPNREIILQDSKIILSLPSENIGMRDTIDKMFNSIALEAGPLAIGIILSGAGFDGTQGLRSIKEHEGIIIVQDPESTEYKSMPQNAIQTGLADFVCRTEEMPELLGGILPKIQSEPLTGVSLKNGEVEHDIRSITNLLYEKTGNDFSKYKKSTIFRRITRRMVIKRIETTEDYLRLLEKDPSEINKLFLELLIGVTSFFRDSEAFFVLEEKVLKNFINNQQDARLRIWVPGCSTGEEAYTIAIIIKELLRNKIAGCDIQIFATDINEQAIVKARLGLFSSTMKQNLPKNIFSDYFHFRPEIGKFQINSEIRDMIIFAVQNVLVDPPFSQIDLISCRNLLIYLDQKQQDKLFQIFHYALKDGGILFLGESETIGKRNSYFSVIDRKYKIFKKLFAVARTSPVTRMASADRFRYRRNDSASYTQLKNTNEDYRDLVEAFVLEQFSPCTILVNGSNEILYIHGRSGLYLEPAEGNMNINITKMAREGLRIPLSNMLRKVKSGKAEQRSRNVEIKSEEDLLHVDILVQPAGTDLNAEEKYIVAFSLREKIQNVGNQIINTNINKDKLPMIQELESELEAMREYLQITIEEKESSNEELQSTNEELQSSNEELQSTNEELETSKEELQSINEELITVNSELENKVEQLTAANNDIDNLLKSTEVATIFLDNEFKIKRFTPSVVSIIDLITGDIGRPLNRIVTNLEYTGLNEDTEYVHQTLNNVEKEVRTRDGRLFLMRIMPYRTLENIVDGVVLTFTDITKLRTIEQEVLQLAKFPDENPFPVMRISREGKLLYANSSCTPVLEELNINDDGLFPQGWANNLRAILDENILTQIEFSTRDKVFIMAVAPIVEEGYVNIYGIDITDRKKAEKELEKRKDQLKLALDSANAGSWRLDLASMEYSIDENFCRMLGYDEEGRKFNPISEQVHPDDWAEFDHSLKTLIDEDAEALSCEYRTKTSGGKWLWIHAWAKKDIEKGRDNISLYGVAINISEQKKLEKNLKHSVEEKSMLLRELAHRTKNNMFVIRSMLSLYAENNDNSEFREIARDIDSKIYSMALVHQKLYKSRNFSQIELKSFFREFLDILFKSYSNPEKNINLYFEAHPVTVHIDKAIPCGIAVAELVSNIFKHAFRGISEGEVRFSLRMAEADVVLLSISDNGCGVPDDFDFRKQDSLGLKTIFMIVEHQIQGRVKFRSENGLTCEIEFSDLKTDGEL